MSRDTNKKVVMCCKTITANLLTIVRLLVEPSTSLVKLKASLETSLYIRQPTWTVTYRKAVISPSLYIFVSFGSMLISNRYSWSTILINVRNSACHCRGRNRTVKINCMESRNCFSLTDLIKWKYVFCWAPSLKWKRIVEAILSKSFREFSDTNQFFIMIYLNP